MGSSAARKKTSALTSRQTSMKTAGRPIITATYPAGDRCQAGSSALIVWFSCERAKAGSAIRLATSASLIHHRPGPPGDRQPAGPPVRIRRAGAFRTRASRDIHGALQARAIHLRREASLEGERHGIVTAPRCCGQSCRQQREGSFGLAKPQPAGMARGEKNPLVTEQCVSSYGISGYSCSTGCSMMTATERCRALRRRRTAPAQPAAVQRDVGGAPPAMSGR